MGSAAPWKVSTCNADPVNQGAGHGKMMPPTWAEEKMKKQVWFNVDEELGDDPYIAPRPDLLP